MDFALSQDQRDVQSAAATWCRDIADPGALRAALDGAPLPDLRPQAGDVGFLGILADGGSVLDLALVAEQAGRVLLPVPFVGTAARAVLLLAGAEASGKDLPLLHEAARGSIAVSVLDGDFAFDEGSGTVTGRSQPALDGGTAGTLLLLAPTPEGPVLLQVTKDEGVDVLQRSPLDAGRDLAVLELRAAPAKLLLRGEAVAPLWARARHVAGVVLAAECLGAVTRATEMAVEYAQQREAFGRRIGSFQAVKHACVDAYVGQELLRSLVWLAAWTADSDPDALPMHAAAAQVLASTTIESVTETLIQVHGGIGFTWEHDAHLFWRRAKVDRLLLGDVVEHREAVASLALAGVGSPA